MIKTSYRSDSFCSYSNYQFNWDNPLVRKVEVERKTPKMKLAYKAEGVVCPKCGKHLLPRRHPNSWDTWLMPRHRPLQQAKTIKPGG